MATLVEMTSEIVASYASTSPMSKEDLLGTISEVYNSLARLEKGETSTVDAAGSATTEETVPAISLKKAFGKDKITCMICGKSMKALTRHLNTSHDMKPKEYRKQFGIPRTQSLASKAYSESRRQMAIDRGLANNLAAARASKIAKAGKTKAKA